jgi:LDH2 family malate/lactate/ureidoglycolate dehydrogenase
VTGAGVEVEVEVEVLRRWAVDALLELGVSQLAAEATAASMLHANRRGLDSHGIVLLGVYAPRLRQGHIRGDAHPELVSDRGALGIFDGNFAPGAHTGKVAMEWCCEAVREHGIGAAAIRNSCHFGAASFLSELAAERGCIGVALTNSDPGMAPRGALAPILGTNPIAIAAPRVDGSVMPSLDIATSVVAQGRVAAAARAGTPIPDGWAIGTDGTTTTDADEAMRNSVLPMAGHKGFGLAFMIDVVTACLSGAQISPAMVEEVGVGHLLIAVDVSAAAGLEVYGRRLERLIGAVHSAARSEDVDAFMIPGEREHRVAREREHTIPLDAATRRLLDSLSTEYGVPLLEGRQPA